MGISCGCFGGDAAGVSAFARDAGNQFGLAHRAMFGENMVFYGLLADKYNQKLAGNAELAMFVLRVEEPGLWLMIWSSGSTIDRSIGRSQALCDCARIISRPCQIKL